MRRFRTLILALGLIALVQTTVFAADAAADGERLFVHQVLPLLKGKCFACHGEKADDIKGQLSLVSREEMLRGGESGEAALVPGKPEESLLYLAVRWEGLEMPPKANDRLSDEQVEALRAWIAAGAPWPAEGRIAEIRRTTSDPGSVKAGVQVRTSGGLAEEWTHRTYDPQDLWAYQPLRKPAPPWEPGVGGSPLDAFLDDRLQRIGATPAPLADRRTLIRRATFDLTGLPPSPEEVQAFLSDPDGDERAFAKVVDRLLASPHYGERWGRHWLDVVRYADSSGFANDYERPNTWRYRDYVVRAFNDDKPYDQFIREQIAGDEIDPDHPEALVAVGFLRMGPWELTGMEVAKVARQRFLDDVTDAVGQVFLSHPLQCARCHDHKFDPIPTRDYYRLQAVFATTQLAEREAPFLPDENIRGFEERERLLRRKARYEQSLREIAARHEEAARAWHAERGLAYLPRNEAMKRGLPEDQIVPRHLGLSPQDLGWERIARKGLERLRWELDRYEPYAFSVYNGRTPELRSVNAPLRTPPDRMTKGILEQPAILAGGDPFSPTIEVSPGVLSVQLMAPDASEAAALDAVPETVEGRRAALADWIARRDNPLTARSIVNRIWLWHFGKAIAGNPNNFGATGKKPTHPELLDWLAATFIEDGWSFKAMHRRIMLSQAYRRASQHPDPTRLSEVDPHGESYAVFAPRRLTAEELRDGMLAASGELNRELGGIPVRPEMNLEAALQPRQVMGTFAPAWQPSPLPSQRHRRSLYALQIRGLRDPFLEAFNQPGPDASCEMRDASLVTPQVFSLFNSQASHQRALAFAHRLMRETARREEAIQRAFLLAYSRAPDREELAACLAHWQTMTERRKDQRVAEPERPVEVIREAVEENTGERFHFVERLDFYEDFVPDLQPGDVDAQTRGLAEVCLVLLNSNEFAYVD